MIAIRHLLQLSSTDYESIWSYFNSQVTQDAVTDGLLHLYHSFPQTVASPLPLYMTFPEGHICVGSLSSMGN